MGPKKRGAPRAPAAESDGEVVARVVRILKAHGNALKASMLPFHFERDAGRPLEWRLTAAGGKAAVAPSRRGTGFIDWIASIPGLSLRVPEEKGSSGLSAVEIVLDAAAAGRGAAKKKPAARKPPKATASNKAETAALVERVLGLIAERPGLFDGVDRVLFRDRLGGCLGRAPEDAKAIKRLYGSLATFLDAVYGPAPDAAPTKNGRAAAAAGARERPGAAPAGPPPPPPPSKPLDLAAFLGDLRLGEHVIASLRDQEVDSVETLALLDEEDLREIGLAIGPRRKLAAAIASL